MDRIWSLFLYPRNASFRPTYPSLECGANNGNVGQWHEGTCEEVGKGIESEILPHLDPSPLRNPATQYLTKLEQDKEEKRKQEVCACARVRVCACACVRVRVRMRVRVRVRVCLVSLACACSKE